MAFAEALNLEVVAEGVETAEHVRSLRRLGCTYAQGFYFSRPLPPDDLGQLLGRSLPAPLAAAAA